MDERIEELLDGVRRTGVSFLNLQFTDVSGAIKTVSLPAGRLRGALEDGVWFDGSAVEGAARVVESDLYLRPDPSTFVLLPWESQPTARLICDLCLPDGAPFPADPRNALRAVLAEAAELGFDYRVSSELEFFVFEDGDSATACPTLKPVDRSGYFEVPDDRAERLCFSTVLALSSVGFQVETTHHEVVAGQQEIDVAELGALEAADAIVTLKSGLKAFASRDHLLISFMPKPIEGVSGSGLHLQQRLVDPRDGSNLFQDPGNRYHLSDLGRWFVAGQLAHARGLCAVVAPLVNSYKRLLGGAEAPSRISWARVNRWSLIRIPELRLKTGTRVEFRASDPACNPYLALAVMLEAGLDGIQNKSSLPAPVEQLDGLEDREERVDPLPETLEEALEELDWDPVVRAALGQPIYERFLAVKAREWLAYRRHISSWELETYLRRA